MTEAELLDLLRRASEALREVGKKALVVKPTLDQPYRDAPDQTPWTRYLEEPARAAYNLGCEIRQVLKQQ